MAQLRQGKEYKKDLTPSCMVHLARGDIAQLVELSSCNWVVAITGWAVRVREGQSLILKTSIRKSWGGKGGKALHSWFSCSWILKNHKNPELEWDSNSSPFEILRRVALWRAQYDESCRLCSGGSSCLSLASMVESVRGLIGGGLPCGGCQRFESVYLQLVNLVDTKLYDSTQFFHFGSSIYYFSFMDIDKIFPFSRTLGWHSLKVKSVVQTRKGLRWIPRHPETRKGVVSDEMLRGVENKRRSGDSRIGEAVECRTLDGESLVAESITSLFSDPSSMGHVESYVNQQGPPCKAKYSWVTDSEVVPVRRGRENASSQCSSTRRYGAEVTHVILLGKARTTFNKRCRKVKEVGDLMTGEPATEAPVNGSRNYNGPKVVKFHVGPYEASLFPGIDFGLFLRSLGPTGQGTVSGRQFLRGVGLPKGNGGVQRFPRAGRRLSLECKGRRELDCKTRAGTKVGLSDPTVLSGRAVAQRIKVTLGITS
ncbi:hypothetical protein Bca4012_042811 [Brassica carinata]